MANDVKWIKITTDIFSDEKILLIEQMPEADTMLVIWFKLLCMAGKENNYGVFLLRNRMPYTEEMLATIFRRPLNTVRLALSTFEAFGMIEIENDIICIPNWEKHQNADGLEKIREQTRKRVARHREKQRNLLESKFCQYCGAIATGEDHIIAMARGGSDTEENRVPCCVECNRIKNDKPLVDFLNANRNRIRDDLIAENEKLQRYVTLCNDLNRYIVTQGNAIEREKEIDIEEDKEKDKKKSKKETTHTLFARLLPDYIISDNLKAKVEEWITYKTQRKEAYQEQGMKTLLRRLENNAIEYGDEAVMCLIDDSMSNGWKGIIFDRLKQQKPARKEPTPKWMAKNQQQYDFDDIEKALTTRTAANDPDIKARADALKQQFGGKSNDRKRSYSKD